VALGIDRDVRHIAGVRAVGASGPVLLVLGVEVAARRLEIGASHFAV